MLMKNSHSLNRKAISHGSRKYNSTKTRQNSLVASSEIENSGAVLGTVIQQRYTGVDSGYANPTPAALMVSLRREGKRNRAYCGICCVSPDDDFDDLETA